MSCNSTVTYNGRTYRSTVNPLPYLAGAVLVNTMLKHAAPHPWRNIPRAVVWVGFGALAFLTYDVSYEGEYSKEKE